MAQVLHLRFRLYKGQWRLFYWDEFFGTWNLLADEDGNGAIQ